MDATRFTAAKTGQLVRIGGNEDWAFIPDPLPCRWSFPYSLWPSLNEASTALARLDGIGQTLPNPELLLQPLRNREAVASSSLEGTHATPAELMLYELNPREPTSERDKVNDWREVSNYSQSLMLGCQELRELPICLRVIKNMHRRLLTGVRGRDKAPGEFRRFQVHIGSDRRFVPPPANHLDGCLDALEQYVNSTTATFEPLVRAYLVHYQFEAIHPFGDGNGRVGRVLLAAMIYKWCNLHLPWLYMSAFFERYKDEYIDKLFRVSTHGDWHGWIEFCIRGTTEQAKDSIRRCSALKRLQIEFSQRAGGAPRLRPIIDRLFTTPLINVTDAARIFEVTYPTAKSDLERLVQLKILAPLPNVRPITYYSPDIFEAAYGQEERGASKPDASTASSQPSEQSPAVVQE